MVSRATINASDDFVMDAQGRLTVVQDLEALRQAALHRMRFFLGEWFLDQSQGVPYFEQVLGHMYDSEVLSQFFTAELLKLEGVTHVVITEIIFNEMTRRLENYTAHLDTVYGPLTITIESVF